ncbi:hypothetical protein [Pseudomonas sp. Hp2]|uniref:hypothetical protein n=1 Tax=Pseudomonas sp. Hp2 TaxID=701189 RepID=UPI001126428D|nr:hypothetical protein [Pseudomonas sp. Hp2]
MNIDNPKAGPKLGNTQGSSAKSEATDPILYDEVRQKIQPPFVSRTQKARAMSEKDKNDKVREFTCCELSKPISAVITEGEDLYAAMRHQFLEPKTVFASKKGVKPQDLVFSPVQEDELKTLFCGD